MKIKIKTTKEYTEQKYLFTFIGFFLLPFMFVWVCRIFAPDASVMDIFQAVGSIYSEGSSWMMPFIIIVWLGASIVSLYTYINAKRMPTEKEFEEIGFDDQGVSFMKKIERQKCFLNYSYENIESFKMEITTQWVQRSKGGPTLGVSRVDLLFKTISDGKEIKVNLFGKVGYIYKVLNYFKRFNNFKYEISGPSGDLGEQIDFYMLKGKKEIFPETSRPTAYIGAVMLFVFAICMAVSMKTEIQEQIIYAIAPTIVLAFSFGLFILLEVDKKMKLEK